MIIFIVLCLYNRSLGKVIEEEQDRIKLWKARAHPSPSIPLEVTAARCEFKECS